MCSFLGIFTFLPQDRKEESRMHPQLEISVGSQYKETFLIANNTSALYGHCQAMEILSPLAS